MNTTTSNGVAVGQKVFALFTEDNRYYDAVVKAVKGGKVTVTYVGFEDDPPRVLDAKNVFPAEQ